MFAKGVYVGFVPGEGAYESKKQAWIAMVSHAESVVDLNLSLSVLQAQEKLKDFIGNKIYIDYGGCDNRCLALWNDNLFGIEKLDRFDFGMTVLYGPPNVKSIFGPRIYTKEGEENTNTNKSIHSITAHLQIITAISLFSMDGHGQNPYEVHSMIPI